MDRCPADLNPNPGIWVDLEEDNSLLPTYFDYSRSFFLNTSNNDTCRATKVQDAVLVAQLDDSTSDKLATLLNDIRTAQSSVTGGTLLSRTLKVEKAHVHELLGQTDSALIIQTAFLSSGNSSDSLLASWRMKRMAAQLDSADLADSLDRIHQDSLLAYLRRGLGTPPSFKPALGGVVSGDFAIVSSRLLNENIGFEVSSEGARSLFVDLFDVLGSQLGTTSRFEARDGINTFSIPTGYLSTGSYFLRISDSKTQETRVIIR